MGFGVPLFRLLKFLLRFFHLRDILFSINTERFLQQRQILDQAIKLIIRATLPPLTREVMLDIEIITHTQSIKLVFGGRIFKEPNRLTKFVRSTALSYGIKHSPP